MNVCAYMVTYNTSTVAGAVRKCAIVFEACAGTCLLEAEVSPAGAGDWLQTNWTLAGQTFDPSLSACTFFPVIVSNFV